MRRSKAKGGLGFRDLKNSNLSLLAKTRVEADKSVMDFIGKNL
jgi:hypothetical protein